MKTRNRAAAGASLALLLALTACNTTGQEGESGPSSDGAPTSASASNPSAEPSPEEGDEGSSPASASEASPSDEDEASPSDEDEAYEPGFGMVTGDQPASEEEGKEKAEEALKRYYEAKGGLLRHRGEGAEVVLPLVARDPQLGSDQERFKQIQDEMTSTYEGQSQVEVLETVTGHTRQPDGSLMENVSITLTVCEDNTGVTVTDENGDPVSTGGAQRYQTKYLVTWTPDDEAWKVKTRWDTEEAEAC